MDDIIISKNQKGGITAKDVNVAPSTNVVVEKAPSQTTRVIGILVAIATIIGVAVAVLTYLGIFVGE